MSAKGLVGFDAFVGNPPFAGKNTLLKAVGSTYVEFLRELHQDSHGNADLVAHFFRRSFSNLRDGGGFGLIATNTIAQGDTRATGLRWIRKHGGHVTFATRRYRWPGAAAVVVSIIHVERKAQPSSAVVLDGREVPTITAFLLTHGPDDDPRPLRANSGTCFLGTNVVGEGFKFDDDADNDEVTPLSVMHRLVENEPSCGGRIFPFLGGEELNDSPTHAPHRYIIDFGDMTEEEARRWPSLMAIVESKVRPKRQRESREAYRRYWWRHGERRVELYSKLPAFERVIASSQTSKYRAFALVSARTVFSTKVVVILDDSYGRFAQVQWRGHELWASFMGSSMKDDPVYTPSDCFETFPFPAGRESLPAVLAAGRAYEMFRAKLMADEATRAELMNGLPPEGLTATYNRFHDPDERRPGILELRALHDQMDRAVLDAYGWTDIQPTCEFLLEYEEEEEEQEGTRRKKKPWRYRWPDAIRDEVLARLIALNAERAAEEARAGADAPAPAAKKARKTKKKTPPPGSGTLFE